MKKAWNMIDVPVYSLVTYDGDKVNMNICTYVTPVSMKPKQYVVGVYHKTRSLRNLLKNRSVVLQLLHKSQVKLVNTLGKKNGIAFNKDHYLRRYNHLENWKGYQVLRNTSARLLLKKRWLKTTGDHTLFLFDVVAHQSFDQEILTLQYLRDSRIVRI